MKFVIAGCAVGALLLGGTATATQEDAATGGGQVMVGTKGAGDTIAFTAQGTLSSASGQIQYVDREGGTGKDQTTYHGTISCIEAVGNVAKMAGAWRDGGTFQLYVEDNGEGAAADSDVVTLTLGAEPTCDFDDPEDEDKVALARGNAQVRDRG